MAIYGDPKSIYGDPTVLYAPAGSAPRPNMAESKNTYSVESVLGFGSSVMAMLSTNKTVMTAKDEDPTARIARLGPLGEQLTVENAKQEKMKTDLREQTTTVERLKGEYYSLASGGCDKVLVAFGRGSEQAKEATNLRKKLRTASSDDEPTPPASPSK